ncbi:hypothetical protein A7456_10410 [Moraxella nonliquefaciens]|uniref:Uncharacterized protein n=1 Tax=Moraxella nonliquefaciens TaxID=478 RepID=A0A1B8QMT8_MORNO|nr:hypothetical protein A7456_10410 [Moraxella nonliquefaciens]
MKTVSKFKVSEIIFLYVFFLFLVNNRDYDEFSDILVNTFKLGSIYDFLFTFVLFICLMTATFIIENIAIYICSFIKNIEKYPYKYLILFIFRYGTFFILCNIFNFVFWYYLMVT